ncbi:hypothetical protein SAY87_014741 [Trapa incisa]|uniref:Uncharacterized protein n=1 Tax=Trapa incisa TaxID=236973 RepID=A0AAN7GXA3_9MYRT|nr:hypothetical protein SAY87_014741 [Trapa incisa]
MESVSMSCGGLNDEEEHEEEEEKRLRAAAQCDSFTFMSCSDMTSSSLRFFSDCEGGDSDSESYIEIELDRRSTAKINSCHKEARPGGQPEEELQLRVSISSTTPFPKLHPPQSWKNIRGADICSSKAGIGDWEDESGISGGKGRGGTRRMAKFTEVCRLLGAVAASLKISPEISREPDISSFHESWKSCHQQSHRSKETEKTGRGRSSARVMKFLFKFRAMQFRSFLASLIKSRPVLGKGNALGHDQSREGRLDKTVRLHHRMDRGSGWNSPEIIAGDEDTRSCPSSIKCSPINRENLGNGREQDGECSIQAAIAHCKKSFTTSSNFSFKTG